MPCVQHTAFKSIIPDITLIIYLSHITVLPIIYHTSRTSHVILSPYCERPPNNNSESIFIIRGYGYFLSPLPLLRGHALAPAVALAPALALAPASAVSLAPDPALAVAPALALTTALAFALLLLLLLLLLSLLRLLLLLLLLYSKGTWSPETPPP